MNINFATESSIRLLGNGYINKMMDIWHEDVKQHLNRDIDILVGNRRRHPALSVYKGLNTQVTVTRLDKRAHLVIWYDPYEVLYAEMLGEMGYGEALINKIGPLLESGADLGADYEPADNLEKLDWDSILRRIGFWVLRVRGFQKIANKDGKFAELDNIVNTECRTPPLNELLTTLGYDFESGLSSVVDDTLEGMSAMEAEPPRRMDRAINALRLWNLMEACSEEDRQRINKVLSASFPRIQEMVIKIGELSGRFDVNIPDENLAFNWSYIKENRLPGDWEAVDEIKEMLKTI
ncbi:MAG: hypothetical protein JEY99_02025 [Spirochaetales bacterium]|nr:hypothetical protein [Spirochaetales bacterium]